MIYENGQLSRILTDVGYKRKSKFFVLLNINKNFCYVRVSKQNDLNSFDSYIGLGILNGLSVGNLGLLYETNLSKSYGVSLNVKPARLDVQREGGRP